MKFCSPVTVVLALSGFLFISGCGSDRSTSQNTKAEEPQVRQVVSSRVAESLAKLNDDDRRLAEEQKFCVVSESSLLGSMGAPVKLDINGQPVFICCEGCEAQAKRDTEATIATAARLRAANTADPDK